MSDITDKNEESRDKNLIRQQLTVDRGADCAVNGALKAEKEGNNVGTEAPNTESSNNAGNEETAETAGNESEKEGKTKSGKKSGIGKLIGGIGIGMAFIIIFEAVALAVLSSGGLNFAKVFGKMAVIDRYIDTYYLYNADADDMADGIFAGMLASLYEDNYAQYYTAEAYEEETIRENGNYIGIGVTVTKDAATGGLLISEVTAYGPAEEAGLLPGDIIIKADGADLTTIEMNDAVENHVKGEAGTKVSLTFMRNGEELNVEVERRNIVNQTVFSKVIETDEIENSRLGNLRLGYISVSQFIRSTFGDFNEAYEGLAEDEEVNGIIIDLRNNGGGDVDICIAMLDRLIADDSVPVRTVNDVDSESDAKPGNGGEAGSAGEAGNTETSGGDRTADGSGTAGKSDNASDEGAVLLTIENKDGEAKDYTAGDRLGTRVPIVVLVNSRSASASEIFAGTMQDYGFMIMGTKTFGKGIVQSVISLYDGSAIKFTTEQYKLPGGAYVHKVGIEPDKIVEFEEFDGVTDTQTNYGKGKEEYILKDNQVNAAIEYLENEAYEAFQRQ